MDVLWVIHSPFVEPVQHCIDRVRTAGASCEMLSIQDYSALQTGERETCLIEPISRAYEGHPTVIVWCMHVGNPDVYPLYLNSPARLNIVIEHDLFSTEPEGTIDTPNPTEIPIFTREHWKCRLLHMRPGLTFTPALWYKVDGYLRPDAQAFVNAPAYASYDKWRYGLFVDSLLYADGPFDAAEPFDAVYLKPWKESRGRGGTVAAPVDVTGPAGIVAAQHLAGFWIARKSSVLAEAIFHGCIPVVHQQPETDECAQFFVQESPAQVYPLSRIRIDKHNPTGGQYMDCVAVTTTGDFGEKIRALQESPELRAQVHKEVAPQWMFGPLETTPLPTVDEIILHRLKELGWTP